MLSHDVQRCAAHPRLTLVAGWSKGCELWSTENLAPQVHVCSRVFCKTNSTQRQPEWLVSTIRYTSLRIHPIHPYTYRTTVLHSVFSSFITCLQKSGFTGRRLHWKSDFQNPCTWRRTIGTTKATLATFCVLLQNTMPNIEILVLARSCIGTWTSRCWVGKPGLAQMRHSLRERGSAEKMQAGYMATTSWGATGGPPTVAF